MRPARSPVTVVLLLGAVVAIPPPPARAAEDIKLTLVTPLSGRWARQGQLQETGTDVAIKKINSQGGIRALGGAKLALREADARDSVEKAASAAQRVEAREDQRRNRLERSEHRRRSGRGPWGGLT